MQEKEYIIALQEGDKNALEQLYLIYSERLFNAILAYLKNREDAEEVLQDVFVALYEKANQFEFNSSIGTWLHRIAINKSLDFLRKRSAKKRFRNSVSIYKKGEKEVINTLADEAQPEQDFIQDESMRLLMSYVDELSENQRIAFHITQIDGLSQLEAAEIMETSRKAVESLVSRARQNLKQKLIKHYPERDKRYNIV